MATIVNKDYCNSCGQVAWLCICEPIEDKGKKYIPSGITKHSAICGDCDSAAAAIWLEPYGSSFLAVISCPNCGTSFDTNLDAADIAALR